MSEQLKIRNKGLRKVRVADIKEAPWNFRTHPDNQKETLAGVIDDLGFYGYPDVFETDDGGVMLIDGELRKDTLIERYGEETEIEVNVTDFKPDEAKKALLTHDPISAMAEKNAETLTQLIEEIDASDDYLKEMVESLKSDIVLPNQEVEDVEPQVSRADELQKKWGTREGQLWIIEGKQKHRLLCGSCVDREHLEKLICDPWQLAVTSPPYNQKVGKFSKSGMHKERKWVDNTNAGSYEDDIPEDEYQKQQSKAVDLWFDWATETASLFYNHKNRFRKKECLSPWRWIDQTSCKVRQEIIWLREGSVTQNMRGFMPVDERIFWIYRSDDFLWNDTTEHKTWSTVWKINSHKDRENSLHGCAFPIELPSRAIKCCSRNEDIVFEPYCGSGTTMLAAEQLNRRCFGMEISSAYCAVILQRMTDAGCDCRLESS